MENAALVARRGKRHAKSLGNEATNCKYLGVQMSDGMIYTYYTLRDFHNKLLQGQYTKEGEGKGEGQGEDAIKSVYRAVFWNFR